MKHDRLPHSSDSALTRRAYWELRHGRIRLAMAENELAWAQEALISGHINPGAALQILDETMDELCGARP